MKSTVPVGTGRSIQRRRDELGYVSNPEFLKEGTAVEDFMQPDRVVVGADEDSDGFGDRVAALYEPLDGPIVRTDVASAEMIKLASNAFLATKISFINEIANVSEELGADVTEVARGMGLDERIGRSSCGRASATAAPASRRTSARSSSSPATRATTSSCSPRSSRSTSSRSGARSASSRSTSARWSARRSRCSAWPSSRTPTTSARPPASCSPRGCRARARTCACTTRSPPTTRRELLGGARVVRLGAGGARRRRRRGARDRVARVRASSTGPARSRTG